MQSSIRCTHLAGNPIVRSKRPEFKMQCIRNIKWPWLFNVKLFPRKSALRIHVRTEQMPATEVYYIFKATAILFKKRQPFRFEWCLKRFQSPFIFNNTSQRRFRISLELARKYVHTCIYIMFATKLRTIKCHRFVKRLVGDTNCPLQN